MAPPPPSVPPTPVPPKKHEQQGWGFTASAVPLWHSSRIDDLAREDSLCKVPEMFCGDARLLICHEASGFQLELNASDAIRCCRWRPPPLVGLWPEAAAEELDQPFFGVVRCQFADAWKPKSNNPDVKELDVTSDWTCSTPYWGSTSCVVDGGSKASISEATEEGLPMDLLRRRDEIHWYQEVLFWEDELDDNGLCRLTVRVRVMPTFWFVLVLCELRVDNVMLREVATRFFCEFGSDHVLREWTWKEATYEALRARRVPLHDNAHISQTSVGTALLGECDVRRQSRHKLRLQPPAAPARPAPGGAEPSGGEAKTEAAA